ncbi:hypothetical protein P154DRAFT_528519 [Amniculicola lignicola CBS 123094]|uniref:Uncharacterized protein n=1 Tax=Amniculicola lignicola CBS 123094 TaxID=1392246 RepID=A0A6A5X4N6_9PLEO|nr:hypothetical protein P154DRAFT_528519 [Amniculicola lignicola CBS 123094]
MPRKIVPNLMVMNTGEVAGVIGSAEESSEDTSDSLDESTEEDFDEVADKEPSQLDGEESFEDISESTEEDFDEVADKEPSQHDDEESFPAGTKDPQKSDIFTEPSFTRGSFLPPLKDTSLQPDQQERQSFRGSNSGSAVGVNDDEELWIEAAINAEIQDLGFVGNG